MRVSFRLISLAILGAAIVAPALAAAPTATAKTLLDTASAKAKREKKNVLVIFHASWCGWCKKMDAMLESPQFKSTFERSYVITHVDVMENGPKKELENEGGQELMTKLGGATAGLPFFVVLSPSGERLGDSFLPNKQNMGYPSEPQEVTAFMTLLQKTAPQMTGTERTTVDSFLRNTKTAGH